MLYWSLEHALPLNPQTIVCNVSHLANQVEALVEVAAVRLQKEILISREQPLPFESGGGLRHAKPLLNLNQDILLSNADEVTLFANHNALKELRDFHQQQKAFATLLTIENPLVGSKFGGVWAQKNEVLGFGKVAIPQTMGWHYVGAMILSPDIFKYLPNQTHSNIIYDGLVNALQAKEKILHFPVDAKWYETGNLPDYLFASQSLCHEVLQKSQHGEFIVSLRERWLGKSSTYVYSQTANLTLSEESLSLSQLTMFEGTNVVGKNCHIDAHVKIKDSVVCSGAMVHHNITNDLVL